MELMIFRKIYIYTLKAHSNFSKLSFKTNKNIIFKMIFYLNCLFLGESSARSIPVNISEEITVDDNKIKYEEITVSNVKSLILSGKKLECDYSLDKLNLWKVDRVSVNKNDEVLETFSTEDDIKENLGGELMNPRYPLSDYFDENSLK